jgi:hypothetical protein
MHVFKIIISQKLYADKMLGCSAHSDLAVVKIALRKCQTKQLIEVSQTAKVLFINTIPDCHY